MTVLGDIENEIVTVVAGLTSGSGPLFGTVRGFSSPDEDVIEPAIRRERPPAAYVVYDGSFLDEQFGVVQQPRFSVLVWAQGLRSRDAARLGDVDTSGIYELLEAVGAALDERVLSNGMQMFIFNERIRIADDRQIIARQRYNLLDFQGQSPPTFQGQALCGPLSVVRVVVGSAARRYARYGFPGIDAVFHQDGGFSGRRIVWVGTLRAATDADLDGIEAALEDVVLRGQPGTVTDERQRAYANCVPLGFERRGPRARHGAARRAVQRFRMIFEQASLG